MACKHLEVSDEAYVNGIRAKAWLCGFVEAEPGRFVDSPTWLLQRIGSCLIRPDHDCVGCRAYVEADNE